ncbi:hypothetical protein MJG53_002778 [Ovis ammon polii x Ovis aries]|uniref:Uncharacterized protein n=1 Tax=Ovis ammon polii x Ovis aries TaxID=2918886 RepID=A0ACB9VFU9_9CETA|nr:hypothetical protein MJG53_002778 [Ovis ammon polii x Ovis aries]
MLLSVSSKKTRNLASKGRLEPNPEPPSEECEPAPPGFLVDNDKEGSLWGMVIHFPPPSFQSFSELGCVALVPVYFEEKQGDEEQAMYREGYDIRVKSHSGGCRGTGQRLEDLCKQGAEMHPNMSARSQRAFEKLNLNSVLLQNKAERAREDAKSHKPQTPQTCIRFYADVGTTGTEVKDGLSPTLMELPFYISDLRTFDPKPE